MAKRTMVFKSFRLVPLLASAFAASILVLVIFLVAPSSTLIIEVMKVSATSTVAIIGLGLVAIAYAKGVLPTKYFGLEASELQGEVSDYVIDVIDFFSGQVLPSIQSPDECKGVDAKIEGLKSQLTDAMVAWNDTCDNIRPTFAVLHEADTKILMIAFADLLNRHENKNREQWGNLLDKRNSLHERHWPLLKRLSVFSDIRRMVSPQFLLIMVFGIAEIVSALAIILSVGILPVNWSYVVYAFHFFLMFYVLIAIIESLWHFLKW